MNLYARCREKTYDEERLKKEDGSTWQSVSGGGKEDPATPYVNPLDGICWTLDIHTLLHWDFASALALGKNDTPVVEYDILLMKQE